MKTSTTGKNPSTLRITVAVAILAGAGLSGCAGDPYYDNRGYSQGYNQPVYHTQRYYESNAPAGYYNPNYSNRPYYADRASGYYYQSPR